VTILAVDRVADGEQLARYVLSPSWLYKDHRQGSPLRPTAFMPHPKIELSVYRIDYWSKVEVDAKGNEVVNEREQNHRARQLAQRKNYPAEKRTFRYLGRAEIKAHDVRSAGLDVVPKEPPVRHADIIGWPGLVGNRKADEATQMAYALKLQSVARFWAPGFCQ